MEQSTARIDRANRDGIPKAARGGTTPATFEVATAHEMYRPQPSEWDDRRASRWLKIQIVRRELIVSVRNALKRDGLETLIRWLDKRRKLPETALGRNHTLHMEFVLADGSLKTWEAEGPVASDP